MIFIKNNQMFKEIKDYIIWRNTKNKQIIFKQIFYAYVLI